MESTKSQNLLSIIENLCNPAHLEREKASHNLILLLKSLPSTEIFLQINEIVKNKLISMLESKKWEEKHSALFALTNLCETVNLFENKPENAVFIQKIHNLIEILLEDTELRVRIGVGNLLKILVIKYQKNMLEFYDTKIKSILYKIIENAFKQIEENKCSKPAENKSENELRKKSGDMESWTNFESSMICIQKIAEGSNQNFIPFIDSKLQEYVSKSILNENRYVREIGLSLLSTLLQICDISHIKTFGLKYASLILLGLSDSWPQVRYAGCLAARAFFAPDRMSPDFLKEFCAILYPAMCINRYYIAEGVRLYAQEMWKNLVADKGREIVLEYLESFIKYYTEQTKAESYGVREAAFHCISEICTKVSVLNKEKVRPFSKNLLDIMIDGMKDLCWPVRNAACAASGKIILVFFKFSIKYRNFRSNVKKN